MITLYNLKQSRSQRITYLLEALNLLYNVQTFERDTVTKLAPKELHDIHRLGKSLLIKDNKTIIAESGAIATKSTPIVSCFLNQLLNVT